MAIQKKSLINNRAAVKKAMIATTAAEATEPVQSGELKAGSLSALSMKRKVTRTAFKARRMRVPY